LIVFLDENGQKKDENEKNAAAKVKLVFLKKISG
jgi:hypothetical protein